MSIHLEGKSRHVLKSLQCQVISLSHETDYLSEFPEVVLLSSSQGMLLEKPNDFGQALETTNSELHSIAVVHGHRSAAKIRLQ